MEQHPKHHYKYCPRCASSGSFNSSHYSFKCLSCGFQFFLNSSAAVTALVFDDDGRLLFSRRAIEPGYGKLDLPGGFVDPGESAEKALFRELKEELDIVPDKIEYLASFPNEYLFSDTVVYTTDLVFRCFIKDISAIKVQDDIMAIELIAPNEVDLNEISFISVRNILKMLVSG